MKRSSRILFAISLIFVSPALKAQSIHEPVHRANTEVSTSLRVDRDSSAATLERTAVMNVYDISGSFIGTKQLTISDVLPESSSQIIYSLPEDSIAGEAKEKEEVKVIAPKQ